MHMHMHNMCMCMCMCMRAWSVLGHLDLVYNLTVLVYNLTVLTVSFCVVPAQEPFSRVTVTRSAAPRT